MSTEIKVRTATPQEHKDFVAGMPEFRFVDRPDSCVVLDGAIIVNLTAEQNVGGACYVPGTLVDAHAALIHLFGIFPEHRPRSGIETTALKSLETELAKNGACVALVTPSTDGFRGTFRRVGYVPAGQSGYYMKVL